jgi:uncharacterized cupin superfamily protein
MTLATRRGAQQRDGWTKIASERRRGQLPGMSELRPPALDPATIAALTSSSYPEPFRSRVLPREKRAIGRALGLTKIGVNVTTLGPGKESSMRHWHTLEDELVFVLEGEVVLRTDEGEQTLTAGMCAGFPAGSTNAHQLVNESGAPVRYLEISNRDDADSAEYPDVDLRYRKGAGGAPEFTRKDGTRY